MAYCRDCSVILPPHVGPGRPRTRCAECSPARNRGRKPAPVSVLAVVHTPPADVVEAARRELTAAGRAESSAGLAALVLAQRLQDSLTDSSVNCATVAKQFSAAMAEAMAAATPAEDVDELEVLRRRRG